MESQPALGTAGLLEALAKEAKEERQTLLAQAQAEAKELIEKTQREGREITERRLVAARSEVASERLRVLGEANLKGADLLLQTKESLLDNAFKNARAELEKRLEGKEGEKILVKLIEEALPDLGDKFSLEVSLEDVSVAQALVKERGLQAEVRANAGIRHGARLISGDGRLVILNTFEARLERANALLRVEVGKLLFGT